MQLKRNILELILQNLFFLDKKNTQNNFIYKNNSTNNSTYNDSYVNNCMTDRGLSNKNYFPQNNKISYIYQKKFK